MPKNKIMGTFRTINLVLYVVAMIMIIVVAAFSIWSAFITLYESVSNITESSIIEALSSIFIVLISIEIIEMFMDYVEKEVIAVNKVLQIVLTALSREMLISTTQFTMMTTPTPMDIWKEVVIILGVAVVAVVYAVLKARTSE
ncbi:MAG: phosphate-starvation-inducible PsiE family protein [Thermocladium sp.]